VFGGFFGLLTSLVLNIKKAEHHIVKSRQSAMIALLGTGFAFATFPFPKMAELIYVIITLAVSVK